jgi:hypothetical protein
VQNRCHNIARAMSVAKAVRLSRRRSSRCSPAGATSAATARAHIRCKDAFPRRTILQSRLRTSDIRNEGGDI